jgi:sortase A
MKVGAARALGALLAVVALSNAACGQRAGEINAVGTGLRVLPRVVVVPGPLAARPAIFTPPPVASSPAAGGRIVIPKIGLDLPTYEGVDAWTLRFGPGHWETTAEPGQVGNTTFAGHRTTFTRPFHDIDQLEPGDEVIFVTATGTFTYRVTDSFVVSDHDSWIADPTDTPTFTIFACHPKGSERERYVVKGEMVTTAL